MLNTLFPITSGRPRLVVTGIALFLSCLIYTGVSAQEEWGGLFFKRLFIDYQTLSADGDFGAFKDYTDGLEFGYTHNFTDRFFVDVPVKIGLGNRKSDYNFRVFGLDVHANYHLRAFDKRLRPYVLAGAGFVMENFDSTNVQFPVGFGLDFRLAPRAYLNWQSEVRFSTSEDKNNFNHGIGFRYMFGTTEEVVLPPPPPADFDGDGIVDSLDRCPTIPGIPAFQGCPDTDGDGIPDLEDECPEYPGLAQFNGCPDSDGDGVPDNDDECPNIPGPVENNGCPYSDRDDDGIIDMNDECPDVPGEAEFNGCPDTDGDGLPDKDDLCPNTPGPISNQGCPEIQQEHREVLEFAVQAVEFEHSSSRLRSDSYGVLNQIVEILNEYPDYRLEISGHTDNTGADDFNQNLSEQRAKACFDYLASQGVPPRRLSYVGYGESRPIATNDTREGRQLNRRVEFNMIPGLGN